MNRWPIRKRRLTGYTNRLVRRFIHAVPINKLFGFGGDTSWPTAALAYSRQARKGLSHALEAEVADGDLTEPEAISIADRLMRRNCFELFRVKE